MKTNWLKLHFGGYLCVSGFANPSLSGSIDNANYVDYSEYQTWSRRPFTGERRAQGSAVSLSK
jgi:hypothetical protein